MSPISEYQSHVKLEKMLFRIHTEQYFLNFGELNPIWIVIKLFSIDFVPNGIQFAVKSIGKVYNYESP